MTLKLQLYSLIKTTLFLLFIFQSNWTYSQCGDLFLLQDSLIKNLGVETREAYLAELKDNQISGHSNLAYFMSYNEFGNITTFHSYDTTGTYPIETYKYLWDNKLSEINITFKNKPEKDYILKYEFNYKGEKVCKRMIQKGKTIFKTDYDYDKKGRLKGETMHNLTKAGYKPNKQKLFYDKDDQLIRRTEVRWGYIANEMYYDASGNRTHLYRIDKNGSQIPYVEKEYNAQNQLVKATNYGPHLLLCGEETQSKIDDTEDVMIITYTYLDNGLLDTERVVKNGILIYSWEYEYLFHGEKN